MAKNRSFEVLKEYLTEKTGVSFTKAETESAILRIAKKYLRVVCHFTPGVGGRVKKTKRYTATARSMDYHFHSVSACAQKPLLALVRAIVLYHNTYLHG